MVLGKFEHPLQADAPGLFFLKPVVVLGNAGLLGGDEDLLGADAILRQFPVTRRNGRCDMRPLPFWLR